MRRDDLTSRQLEAVEAREKVILVKGGPGSGKTTTALWAAREAVTTGQLQAGQYVLFLTFSRTAVSQISRGAPTVMEDAEGRVEVITFHALSFRLLRAFGRYVGLGTQLPRIQSEASRRLMGALGANLITYDDMVPAALRILAPGRAWDLLSRRWPVVICDEFQDTGDGQWQLVLRLGEVGRLILLADPDQMIYDFRRDVRPERIAEAAGIAERLVDLEERSHRDPSGTIPALARAVLSRDFGHEAVRYAVETERLRVRSFVDPDDLAELVHGEVSRLRQAGCTTVGVFGFTNDGVALLGAQLSARGVSNVIIGLPEALGEGIASMAALAGHAVGLRSAEEVKAALATFLTATTRPPNVPPVALALVGRAQMPAGLDELISQLLRALRDASVDGSIGDVLNVVRQAWSRLFRGAQGSRLWRRAAAQFAGLAHDLLSRPASEDTIRVLLERSDRAYSAALVNEIEESRTRAVQLMNFHQTKGREADGVILVFRPDDFYARRNETEPYPARSRLLYVAISRARSRLTLIMPIEPHPLISPFADYAVDRNATFVRDEIPF